MSSLKMTFSLTSLIFLIALGLVFAPITVMAHTKAESRTEDGITPPLHDQDEGQIVAPEPAAHRHPTVEITIMDADPTAGGIQVVDSGKDNTGTGAPDFSGAVAPTIQFDVMLTVPAGVMDSSGDTVADMSATAFGTVAGIAYDHKTSLAVGTGTDGAIEFSTWIQPDADGKPQEWKATAKITFTTPEASSKSDAAAAKAENKKRHDDAIAAAIKAGIGVDVTVPAGIIESGAIRPPYQDQENRKAVATVTVISKAPTDKTAPTVVISSIPASDTALPTANAAKTETKAAVKKGQVLFIFDFSEEIKDGSLTIGNIHILGGTTDDTPMMSTLDADEDEHIYHLYVTPSTGATEVTVTLLKGSVEDTSGNALKASASLTWVSPTRAAPDEKAPTVHIRAPKMAESDGSVIFTIDFDEALGTGAEALVVNNLTVEGKKAETTPTLSDAVKDPKDVTMTVGDKDDVPVKERYTLTVMPGTTGIVTVSLDADSVGDAADNLVDVTGPGATATFDGKAPTVTITPPDAPDADGNLVFSFVFSEPIKADTFTSADIRGSGFDILASLPAKQTSTDATIMTETWTVKITPKVANTPVTVAISAGAVEDMNSNQLAAGVTATYTPAPPEAPAAPVVTAEAGVNKVTLKWTVVADAMYEYRKKTGDAAFKADDTDYMPIAAEALKAGTGDDAGKSLYEVTGLAGGTEYTFQVRVKADAPTPAGEDSISVMATPTKPSTGPTATQIGSKKYLVVVPPNHNPDALPAGLTTHTEADMPNLFEFFETGGTIDVVVTGKAKHDVIITEIMLARDLGRVGLTETDRPEAGQWIELYNNTAAHINLSDIAINFREESPATDALANTTDRISNTVSGAGWGITTFEKALSGETAAAVVGTGEAARRTVVAGKEFKSLRRVYKDDATTRLQDVTAADQILNGWLSSTWTLTADSRVFLAGRIGTPGKENRPTVYAPPVYKAPTMTVTFNEIANLSDDSNEWIELKGAKDTNLRHHTIKMVTGYDKATNTGDETLIYAFPTDADVKIPATGILLLTDKSPSDNKLEADIEDGVEKPVRYRIVTLAPLPNDKEFLLVLRDKDGANILDVAGHVSGDTLKDDDPYTLMWPLAANVGAAKPGRISALNKLSVGNVYKRARNIQGYLANKDDGKEPAFEGAGFTGIGYDRNVSPANKEHHGTPGYPNNAQIANGTAAMDHVFISEVMYGDGTHQWPQWIEIQNRSDTNGVDLHNWKLYIANHSMNADGSSFEGKLVDSFFLRGVKIPPKQTALVVSKAGRNNTKLPPHRILNLKRKGNDPLLSSKGFYLFLVANAHEGDLAKRQAGDDAGNLPAPKETATRTNIELFNDPISILRAFDDQEPAWELPAGMNSDGFRVSIARKGSNKILNPDGTLETHWLSSEEDKRSYNLGTSYGRLTDIGTPGNTPGAPLPVSLSKFRPERLKDTGEVVVRWITESELNNAGFNILRSEKRDGEFTKVHFRAGQGTTSERTVYEWKDTSAKPNVVYYYQIQDISLDGKVTTLRVTHLRGNVTAVGKVTTTWGEIKALQ